MSSLMHHGVKGQRWGVRRFQNKDGTLTAAGRKRKQHLIEVGSGKRKRLVEAAKPIGTSGDYSRDVTGLNRRGIHGKVVNEDDNTHIIKKGTSIYRTAANSELNDDGTYGSLTKNDVDRYIDYGRSGELPGADKSNLNSMKIFEFSANRDLKIANGKYITEIITDDVKHKMKNGDDDQVKLGKEILKSFKRYEEDLNLSFSTSEMRRSKEAYSRTEKEKEFDRDLVGKASDRLALYDKTILDYSSGKDYRVIRDRLKREGYDGFIDVEDVTTIENLVRGGANTEYPVVILNANDVLTLKRSVKESETQRRLKRGTKFNSSRGELTDVVQHTSIGGTMYVEGNALILGDSSYLEHHGIRGQRWGVRRFQNRDGSLTNAGRKRLGYATKGAAQTVGKAFKAGVKAGGNAVKAVKAHHEKKEAEKLQKKKEKASKTRLGVMANKDLFTNEELKKLNDRFKLEDEMKMATLQKGVEIAKAVGTIAQNVGTVAKAYEDVTGTSLSPIKRKAAEEKARQDAEDRERRIAREDADEARKAAKEERDIAIHEQTLRKAIAAADTQEFTAQKTKAEADSSVLDAIKKGQDFNGGSGTDASGQSWMEKATAGGKNPFFEENLKNDPELAAAKAAHDAKAEWKQHEQERDARIAAREKEAAAKQSQPQPQQKQGGGDDDALFSQKGSLPIDKDRYKNSRAIEKAKHAKEDAAEERAKKQDEKAAKATIDDMMEAKRQFTDSARANSDGAFDRETAANYIKGKAKELPSKLNPINAIAKKITDKALKEQEAASRKAMEDEYKKTSRSQGRDEANYTMYYNRVNALQAQGYSERQAKKVADTESPFSSKRNRRFEYNEKVGEIETTHRKNAKEINKANRELTDYYYKLINGPGYDPGTPKREALDRKYAQKRGELERLEKDNNEMLDREKKKAKKILEHSLSIQNGVLFINAGEPYLEHHGVKGMKWGKHLMAGKGVDAEAGGGGGFAEDDEKLKEMAKKAGMSVAEYRTKMAGKLSGAASKVGSAVYNAAGGSHKTEAAAYRREAQKQNAEEQYQKARANKLKAASASEKRKAQKLLDSGDNGGYVNASINSKNWKSSADTADSKARDASKRREKAQKTANEEQSKYEKSLAGKYDKMKAGRAKQVKDLSAKASAAKKRLKDIPGELYGSKHRKDFERNARLLEGSTRSAVELGRDTYKRHGPTSGFGDPTYKATDDAYKRANKQWNKARVSGQKYDRSIAKRVDSLARKASKVRKTIEQKKLFSGTSPKAKKAVIVKKKVTPTSYEKQISNARDDVEKAARSNEAAYRHAKEVYRQTGGDSDAYKQAIKRSRTTLQRSLESQKRLKQKKRAKHSDDTNAVYTEGTRLVIHPKA